jgi:hypothetical protein
MFQLAVAHPISWSLGKVNGEIDGDKEQNFRENTSSPSAVLRPIFVVTLIPTVVGSGWQEIARPHPHQFQLSSNCGFLAIIRSLEMTPVIRTI